MRALDARLAQVDGNLDGLTCLAGGADLLFAEAVLRHGIKLEAVVPAQEYRDGLPKHVHAAYDNLISQATAIHRYDYRFSDSDAHTAASKLMVDKSDQLFAVWDDMSARASGHASSSRCRRNLGAPARPGHLGGESLAPHVASCQIVGGVEEHLTVGRVAELAGVSVRTLHHYDEVGLLQPSTRTAAGHRAYSADDVERLRKVLAYRRLGFGLREISDLVDDPATDAVAHLCRLRSLLMDQRDRAAAMVTAIDRELAARAMGIRTTPEEQLEMFGAQLYDAIGSAYPATRRTEPRIATRIWDALG